MTSFNKIVRACAFAIAVLLVFVTSSFKGANMTKGGQTLYRFAYDVNSPYIGTPYSQTSVEDERNWTYSPSEGCDLGEDKACTIEATQVDDPNSPSPVLLQAENISAPLNSNGDHPVASTIDGSSTAVISNRAN